MQRQWYMHHMDAVTIDHEHFWHVVCHILWIQYFIVPQKIYYVPKNGIKLIMCLLSFWNNERCPGYYVILFCSPQGFHVYKIAEGSPAHQVGVIVVGDRLLKVRSNPLTYTVAYNWWWWVCLMLEVYSSVFWSVFLEIPVCDRYCG